MATLAEAEAGALWLDLIRLKFTLRTLRRTAQFSSDWAKVRRLEANVAGAEKRLTILRENR